jgi:trigger factor
MNIVKKDIDQNNAIVTISIEKSDYAEKVEKQIRDYRKKANMPGFRPGMVPVGLIKKMYGKAFLAEEVNKLVSDGLYDYIRQNNINILGEPMPNETEQQPINFDEQETFDFVFDLGIAPEFNVELTKKDKVKSYNIKIDDEMIDNQIKSHQSRFGKYEQEETVEENDMVKGELVELEDKKVKEDGITVPDGVLMPAYMKTATYKKKFIGAKIGDVIVFNPSKAFENETEIASLLKIDKAEVANVNSDFQFTINSITRYHEAEINQELFDKVYGEGAVAGEEDFRNKIKENVALSLEQDTNYRFGLDAREMLLKKFDDLVFPDAFLKRWLQASNENLTSEKMEEDYSKIIDDLKWHLVKDKIAKNAEIKVEEAEIRNYAKQMAKAQFAQYGMVGLEDSIIENYAQEMLKKEDSIRGIIDRVLENKVFDSVKNNVTLETKEISMDDFNKLFEAK